jgi:hypothetical protein
MLNCEYILMVHASDELAATEEARRLADDLRDRTGVLAADRRKADEQTMDLGSIVAVLATSGATVAIAQGLADWLRRRRGTQLTIERTSSSGSIKVVVERIDPEAALRITELVSGD